MKKIKLFFMALLIAMFSFNLANAEVKVRPDPYFWDDVSGIGSELIRMGFPFNVSNAENNWFLDIRVPFTLFESLQEKYKQDGETWDVIGFLRKFYEQHKVINEEGYLESFTTTGVCLEDTLDDGRVSISCNLFYQGIPFTLFTIDNFINNLYAGNPKGLDPVVVGSGNATLSLTMIFDGPVEKIAFFKASEYKNINMTAYGTGTDKDGKTRQILVNQHSPDGNTYTVDTIELN